MLGVQGAHDWAHYKLVITSLMSQTPWECFRSQDWAWCLCRKRNAFIPCLAVGRRLLQIGNTELESSSTARVRKGTGPQLLMAEPASSSSKLGTASSPTVSQLGQKEAVCMPWLQPLTPRAGGSHLQLYHSFVNFNAFVNTGHTDNPLHFSCLIPTDYNLLTLLGSEWTTLAENHKHCFGDEEERTFNSKKLNKLLRALVLMWASQVFGYLVWSTVTELCSASKARGIWEKTANANQRCSRHQLIGYKGFLCHWLRLCCTAPKTSLCPRALCPQRIGFRLWCICFCKVREFYHELLHNKPTSSFVPKWGPYSIFYSCIFNM